MPSPPPPPPLKKPPSIKCDRPLEALQSLGAASAFFTCQSCLPPTRLRSSLIPPPHLGGFRRRPSLLLGQNGCRLAARVPFQHSDKITTLVSLSLMSRRHKRNRRHLPCDGQQTRRVVRTPRTTAGKPVCTFLNSLVWIHLSRIQIKEPSKTLLGLVWRPSESVT